MLPKQHTQPITIPLQTPPMPQENLWHKTTKVWSPRKTYAQTTPSYPIYIQFLHTPYGKGNDNLARPRVCNLINDMKNSGMGATRLPKHSMCRTLWLALNKTQNFPHDIRISTNNLNVVYVLNIHIRRPSSQHNHPYKLLQTSLIRRRRTPVPVKGAGVNKVFVRKNTLGHTPGYWRWA